MHFNRFCINHTLFLGIYKGITCEGRLFFVILYCSFPSSFFPTFPVLAGPKLMFNRFFFKTKTSTVNADLVEFVYHRWPRFVIVSYMKSEHKLISDFIRRHNLWLIRKRIKLNPNSQNAWSLVTSHNTISTWRQISRRSH